MFFAAHRDQTLLKPRPLCPACGRSDDWSIRCRSFSIDPRIVASETDGAARCLVGASF